MSAPPREPREGESRCPAMLGQEQCVWIEGTNHGHLTLSGVGWIELAGPSVMEKTT